MPECIGDELFLIIINFAMTLKGRSVWHTDTFPRQKFQVPVLLELVLDPESRRPDDPDEAVAAQCGVWRELELLRQVCCLQVASTEIPPGVLAIQTFLQKHPPLSHYHTHHRSV
jgi:hypothetical protein